MLFCRGPQGKLARQLSHPLKIKYLLTYLLTRMSFYTHQDNEILNVAVGELFESSAFALCYFCFFICTFIIKINYMLNRL